MEKYADLRFIIGTFFVISGGLLVSLAFLVTSGKEFGKSLNMYAGSAMLIFGLFMLWMNHRSSKNQEHVEGE